MIEVEKKNSDAMILNFLSSMIFISLALVLLATMKTAEMCVISGIFGFIGLVTGILSLSMLNPTRIRVGGYITIIEQNKTRRYSMKEIERIDVRRTKRATVISMVLGNGKKRIITGQGISQKDIETLIKALKESAYREGVPFDIADERRPSASSNQDMLGTEDAGDSPYRIK